MRKQTLLSGFMIFFLLGFSFVTQAQFSLDVESGVAFPGYNKVQVPNPAGTRFDLNEELDINNQVFYRIRPSYTLNDKHVFSVLFAPLGLNAQGTIKQDINFNEVSFASGDSLDARYEFNSYRFTYRFLFARSGDFQFGLGATAKIRDAKISLDDGEQSTRKTDLGFVPLINFHVEWFAKERLSILLQGDALVGKQGRAEDVLLAALFYPKTNVALKAGYRILEGGADVDEVYNFTLVHYAVIGAVFTF